MTRKNESDLIYRQDAINLIKKWAAGYSYIENETELAIKAFKQLPSAQPERKRGLWISDLAFYDDEGCPCIVLRCSECGGVHPKTNFCPNCGADMRKGEEE